jgi:glycosyltransferase involved in cell wall biosynthesis
MPTRGRPTQISKVRQLLGRLVTVIEREGALALTRRKLVQLRGLFAERSRLWRFGRRSWQHDNRPVFLMISHRCGGGTERHVGDLETGLRAEGVRPVVVRPGRRGGLLWEERGDRARTHWCRESSTERESIARLLGELGPVHAHVHHSMGLPEVLFDLLVERMIPYDWTIHDDHSICPRINLIGSDGRYCGEPDTAACDRCLARLGDDQGRAVSESIAAWRRRSANRLASARRVFAPSPDVARRLERYFPRRIVTLRPHPDSIPRLESLAAPLKAGEAVRVAVIGTLTKVKGSERLLACANDARLRGLPLEFHVIGATDRDALLARQRNVHVTGRYRESDVYDRLKARRCHLAFLPSECPESYMYTLSIAMAARLFVVCFDLGAQALRVRAWGWGNAIPIELGPAAINDELIRAAKSLSAANNPPEAPDSSQYPDLLASYYDFTAGERDRIAGRDSRHAHSMRSSPHVIRGRDHAHLH